MSTEAREAIPIVSEDISVQKSFLEMQDPETQVLKSLQTFAIEACPQVAKEFYDQLFSDEALFHYFEGLAKKRKMNLSDLRAQLELATAEHFLGFFTGLDGEWGPAYFEHSLFSGKEGEGVLLPPTWYIAANAHLAKIVITKLAKKFWFRPLYVKKASEALLKLLNLNEQKVVERYTQPFSRIVSEVQSASEHTAGATHRIQEIIAEQSSRLAEHSAEVHQVEETVDGLHARLGQVEEMSDQLGEALGKAMGAMKEIQERVASLADSIREQKLASERAKDAVRQMEGASGQFVASTQQTLDSAMELEREMSHLQSVVGEMQGPAVH